MIGTTQGTPFSSGGLTKPMFPLMFDGTGFLFSARFWLSRYTTTPVPAVSRPILRPMTNGGSAERPSRRRPSWDDSLCTA